MGDFIKDAFGRMNLQQIRSFFLHGTDDFTEKEQPYRDKLKQSSDPIYKRLETIYTDTEELDEAAADLSQALTENYSLGELFKQRHRAVLCKAYSKGSLPTKWYGCPCFRKC